jgi:general secretion pathway protein N
VRVAYDFQTIEGLAMKLSRTARVIGAGVLLLSVAAAVAAVSANIGAPSDNAIGTIHADETKRPKASPPQDAKVEQQPKPTLSGNSLWAIPLKDLTATQERPIFSASRRPPTTPVIAAPAAPAGAVPIPVEFPRPRLKLVGTIIGTSRALGIFQDQTSNRGLRLQTDEMHDGWVLEEVSARQVVFQRNNERLILALPVEWAQEANSIAGANCTPNDRTRKRAF